MKKWIGWAITLGGLGIMMVVIMGRVEDVQTARANPEKVVLPPAAVRVMAVESRDLNRIERSSGEVRARHVVQVVPKVGGRVMSLAKGLGDTVEADEIMAVLDEGEMAWRVKQGEAGAAAARAGTRQASVQLELARTESERAEKLHANQGIPEADLIRARGGVKAAEAAVAAAKAQITVAEAGLGLAREALGWTQIKAPMAGVITKRLADVGNMVGPQGPIFEIQDQSSLEVFVDLDPAAIRAIETGASARAHIDGLPAGAGFPLELKTTGKSVDPMTRKVRAEFVLPAEAGAAGALPHMVAHVQVSLPGDKGVLTAPMESVVKLAEGASVLIVRDGRSQRVATLGAAVDPKYVVLKSGDGPDAARPGDQVVVEGHLDLKVGAEVRIIDAKSGGK